MSFFVIYSLTFSKLIVTYAFQYRHVKKQVFASTRVDKSKTFVCNSFDRTFSHSSILCVVFYATLP